MNFPPQCGVRTQVPIRGDRTDAPSSAPSSYCDYRHPVPGHSRGHVSVVQYANVGDWRCDCGDLRGLILPIFDQLPPANAAGNHWPNEDREDIPPPVENIADQGEPQDMGYDDMGYYDVDNGHPPLHDGHDHRDHAINNHGGAALDVPAQAQAAAPPTPVCTEPAFVLHTHI